MMNINSNSSPRPNSLLSIQILYATFLLAALCLTAIIYWPGLSGPFLLDDFGSISPIGNNGGITNLQRFIEYVLGGTAGPTGRPISLLTFALNDQHWPSDPRAFKFTNLMLHLLNGALAFALARKLALFTPCKPQHVNAISLATMLIWLLHPLQLSPVFLVVQRMTELSAMFCFAGILCYLHGRNSLSERTVYGTSWMCIGIGFMGLLAVLSKENGALLPLLSLITIGCLPIGGIKSKLARNMDRLLIGLPITLLVGYIIYRWPSLLNNFEGREFSMGERIITQACVVTEYLKNYVVPSLGGSGLFHDDYPVAESIFESAKTAGCVILIVTALLASVIYRRKYPVAAFSVLWFLAAHSMEATIFPLEMYFEHRNYLPIFGLAFGTSYFALSKTGNLSGLFRFLLVAFILMLGTLTWHQSKIWGSEHLLVEIWAKENNQSLRAQQLAANYWARRGEHDKTNDYLKTAMANNPESLTLHLQYAQSTCVTNTSVKSAITNAAAVASTTNYEASITNTLQDIVNYLRERPCKWFTNNDVILIIDNLLNNPQYTSRYNELANLLLIKGLLYGEKRQLNLAMETLDASFAANPREDVAFKQVEWLASAGLYEDALKYLDRAYSVKQPWYTSYFNFPRAIDYEQARNYLVAQKQKMQDAPKNRN